MKLENDIFVNLTLKDWGKNWASLSWAELSQHKIELKPAQAKNSGFHTDFRRPLKLLANSNELWSSCLGGTNAWCRKSFVPLDRAIRGIKWLLLSEIFMTSIFGGERGKTEGQLFFNKRMLLFPLTFHNFADYTLNNRYGMLMFDLDNVVLQDGKNRHLQRGPEW